MARFRVPISWLLLIGFLVGIAALAGPSEELPVTSYEGREGDAPWRKAAHQRIEQFRKGNLVVRVLDRQGKPVAGASVFVEMKRHGFRFGSQVYADLLNASGPESDLYRRKFLELFNFAALDKFFYPQWKTPEGAAKNRSQAAQANRWSKEDHSQATRAIRWLKENNIPIFGHVLVWNLNDETLNGNDSQVHEVVKRHIDDVLGDPFIAEEVAEWDVLNESFFNSDIFRRLGREGAVEWFKLAHKYAPNARLFLNEDKLISRMDVPRREEHLVSTEELVRFLQAEGAPIHGLGLQSHHIGSLTSIPEVLSTLERLSRLNVDLEITEYDVRLVPTTGGGTFVEKWRTPPLSPPPPEMEQLEADYLRDYLTACFSQPQVTAFVLWGFWDGRQWIFNAPLLRKDGSLKPAGRVWKRLLFEEWWTNVKGDTNEGGRYETRGFLGDYEITVQKDDLRETIQMTLPPGGSRVEIIL